mmetsp:Transcript_81684/g.236008  ORF Transcript_81684/g.236008 Transcript_81684/m.236008 type:complete len:82 (-) Transcript_81684:96-341(-)
MVFRPNPARPTFDCRLWTASRSHAQDQRLRTYQDHITLGTQHSAESRAQWVNGNWNAENLVSYGHSPGNPRAGHVRVQRRL